MLRLPRLVLVLPLVCGVLTSAASAQVTITDLGLVGGLPNSSANAINNVGDVVGIGTVTQSSGSRAVIWRNGVGELLDLGCPGCETIANDINDAGDVVGFMFGGGLPGSTAFLWRSGVTTILPPLPGDTGARANEINSLGVIVGQSSGPSGSRPVRWINGLPEQLGSLGGATGSASSINDAGVIVGQSQNGSGVTLPFVWSNGSMTALSVLPDPVCNTANTATGINEAGVVVGTTVANCVSVAVRWVNGAIDPLPLPAHTPGVPFFSQAFDINEAGDIVGTTGGSGQQQATLWRDGQVIPLGVMPGFAQSIAGEINDGGLIAGRSLTFGASSAARAHTISFAPANTPPTLTLPSHLTVDATSPGGAVVSFASTANDAEDGAFLPSCTPASGSLFAIGATTVSCTATDSGGLDATGSFTVTVLGATAQIDALLADATGVGPRSLENTLRVARGAIVAQRPLTAAVTLTVFDLQVTLLAITRRLPVDQAIALIGASRQIRATLGF